MSDWIYIVGGATMLITIILILFAGNKKKAPFDTRKNKALSKLPKSNTSTKMPPVKKSKPPKHLPGFAPTRDYLTDLTGYMRNLALKNVKTTESTESGWAYDLAKIQHQHTEELKKIKTFTKIELMKIVGDLDDNLKKIKDATGYWTVSSHMQRVLDDKLKRKKSVAGSPAVEFSSIKLDYENAHAQLAKRISEDNLERTRMALRLEKRRNETANRQRSRPPCR